MWHSLSLSGQSSLLANLLSRSRPSLVQRWRPAVHARRTSRTAVSVAHNAIVLAISGERRSPDHHKKPSCRSHRNRHSRSSALVWFDRSYRVSSVYTVCSKKSDAKIEIILTATNLIRIKYPLSSLNYHLSGANVANFNKIHCTVFEQQLFKQETHQEMR